MANVIFKVGTRAQYDALETKDTSTLYWLTDVQELYKGETLYGKGSVATNLASGLMSSEDKAKLDSIVVDGSGSTVNLTAVDSTVLIETGDDGAVTIGVQVSKEDGNAIETKADGLYVAPSTTAAMVWEDMTVAE